MYQRKRFISCVAVYPLRLSSHLTAFISFCSHFVLILAFLQPTINLHLISHFKHLLIAAKIFLLNEYSVKI